MRTIIRFRWWYLFFFAGSFALLASFQLDAGTQIWIAQLQSTGMKTCMYAVSRFGDWPEHFVLGFFLLGLAWWRGSKRWLRIGAAMLVACALAGAVARVVKISAGRARPSVRTEAAWSGPNISSRYNAFPSGHTAISTAFFATLALASWRIGAPLLVIPLLIAFSRMYVAAHHLSDVVCAALLGMLAAYFAKRWLLSGIENRQSEI